MILAAERAACGKQGLPPVLILGETGTGKELIARALHFDGARRERPFVEVNCAALPEQLVESELFGHERGAFTDARERKAGLFQAADGGTLFLDEVGDLTLAAQAKVLKAIEERVVRPVGGLRDRRVDVRVVAATNASLEDKVRQNEFRSDLFYRLNVHHIHLPPLRERPGDVELLLNAFLDRVGPPAGVAAISADARAALLAFDYPGNVRQLEHMIQRAVAVAHGATVEVADLPEEIFARGADPHSAAADNTVAAARERAEREMIAATLARNNGEVTSSARELQVSRTTLWRLMKKHQI